MRKIKPDKKTKQKTRIKGHRKTAEERLISVTNTQNKSDLLKFVAYLRANNKSKARIDKYSWILVNVSYWLNNNFKKAEKEDIEKVVVKIESSDYTPWTKHDYKAAIKTFYKWLEGDNEEFPKKVRWIKPKLKLIKTTVGASDILKKDEVVKMIEVSNNLRNKALISVLYETGIRVGELLGMKIKDIDIDDYMISIHVDGKTGKRTVFLRGFKKHLIDYLNSHPFRDNREAYVWCGDSPNEHVHYSRVTDLIKRAALNSGMEKERSMKVHPHLFRHSIATTMSSILTEQEMKKLFGWTQESEMAAIYCHLSAHDVKNSVASKVYGLTNGEIKQKEDTLKPKLCESCGRENPADAKFCNCGTILDIRTAIEMEQKLKKARYVEDKIVGNNVLDLHSKLKDLEKQIKIINMSQKIIKSAGNK